jgi:hypothetical protein
MPIHEADPWRFQYFHRVPCPDDLDIPTEDSDAWTWYPQYAWVYDKLRVAQSQGLPCGPHGTAPPSFPVFSKPISNLRGMGAQSRIIASPDEYERLFTPGHMWVTLLQGRHVSTDVAVVNGEPKWWRHTTGKAAGEGTFDYWTIHAAPDLALEHYCGNWVRRHLQGYTGVVNLETIGGVIIEAHLRLTDQWPDLYGVGWVAAVVQLYRRQIWDFADAYRREAYSVVLFGPKGPAYCHPRRELANEILKMPGVSSLQLTFHQDREPERHAMPPGGFRLAIVNAWDLEAGQAAREKLKSHFFAAAA